MKYQIVRKDEYETGDEDARECQYEKPYCYTLTEMNYLGVRKTKKELLHIFGAFFSLQHCEISANKRAKWNSAYP